jgi:transcriptional regulator with XRE-family HTH domain
MPARRKPQRDVRPLYSALGVSIREARSHAGLSQDDLANAVGLSRTSITNLEGGGQFVPLHTLYDIAVALGLRIADLLPEAYEGSPQQVYDEDDVSRWATQLARQTRRTSA